MSQDNTDSPRHASNPRHAADAGTTDAGTTTPSHATAPTHTPTTPRTREDLEGATATPLGHGPDPSGTPQDPLGTAEPLKPSVTPRHFRRGRFEETFQQDLEPESSVARRLRPVSSRGSGPANAANVDAAGSKITANGTAAGEAKAGPRRRRRRVPLAAKVLLAFVLAAIVVVAVAIAVWVGDLNRSMGVDEADRADLEEALVKPEESEPVADSSAFYALVIGSDAREGDTASRSDVIILARVDPANATVTLVSIPRDTMITSSGSVEKINAAYNYGPASAVRAVSEFAGVDIAHYVEVDFEGLESVVDALGGVTVDIPEDIPAGNGGASFSAGEQTLTGAEALAYARERYSVSGGDFSRAQAQRQILSAIVQKVLAASPTDMPRLISQLAQSISTDLSVPDIISYALELQGSGHGLSIYSCITPSYTLSQDGVSYVATMYEEWRQMMQLVDAGLDPNDISAEVPQQQAEDERLGSASNAAGPRDYEALAADAGLTTADVPEPESAE